MSIPELFERLGLALAIGFLFGVERGWKRREAGEGARVAGLRTYTLAGLLGGVAGQLSVTLGALALVAVALPFAAAFIAFSWRKHVEEHDYSVTGAVAGLLAFALGTYAQVGPAQVAAGMAVAAVLVLAMKSPLHDWLRGISWPELRSGLLLLAATCIALPLLPSEPIDPLGAINPRELWVLTILIAAASFVGYVALRVFGPHRGLLLGAAAGAIVSSTVVTLDLARRAREGASVVSAAAAASLASAVMAARVLALTAVIAVPALPGVWPALAAGGALALAFAFALASRGGRAVGMAPTEGAVFPHLRSPLDLVQVGRFAALLCVLSVGARLASHYLGAAGLLAFAATAGMADVDAVTLAVGRTLQSGGDPGVAAHAILLAVLMDSLSKTLIAALAGGARFAWVFGGVTAASLAGGLVAYLLT